MFKRMFEASSPAGRATAPAGQGSASGLPSPTTNNERVHNESPTGSSTAKLPPFAEIYKKSTFHTASTNTTFDILKVSEMINSDHLRGLSPSAKHSALMMALEAAGVAVEDMLQDAVQRQRVLNEYEEGERQRLERFEHAKLGDNGRLAAEMESICVQYRGRIASGVQEIEQEREAFREWQERKTREQRRIAEAASACVSDDMGLASDASVTRLLEKNTAGLRQSA